jgi:hypothetical protein
MAATLLVATQVATAMQATAEAKTKSTDARRSARGGCYRDAKPRSGGDKAKSGGERKPGGKRGRLFNKATNRPYR